MTPAPVIIVLGPSALVTAERIRSVVSGAQIHGLAGRVEDADLTFESATGHIAELFAAGHLVVGVCASGILIRAVAPHLDDKRTEPPVIAVAEDGSSAVPLLGGHHGANDLARTIADHLNGHAAVTTAGDVRFGIALDCPPAAWSLANPQDAKAVTARLLSGESVAIEGALPWLDRDALRVEETADLRLIESVRKAVSRPGALIYHPRKVVIGVGCDRGCPPEDLRALVGEQLDASGLAPEAIAAVVSIDRKADEPAIHVLAEHFRVPARFYTAAEINTVAERIPNPSDIVHREVGVPGVAEGCALLAAGCERLLVTKQKTARATCAIAVARDVIEPASIGRPRGRLAIVGIGPGDKSWRSPQATALLTAATDWVGYGLYLDLVQDLNAGKTEHRFELGAEEDRVRHALERAAEGHDVALVCSGDAGIYAMATLAFELIALADVEGGVSDAARRVEIEVAPGISAVQAAAARAGAPLGHDFCCISLSDLLTPWEAIEARVRAAAEADFVVGFYNPRSMRRRDQIVHAMKILSTHRPSDTPVIIATSLGRDREQIRHTTVGEFNPEQVDMVSLVIVGSSATRTVRTGDGRTWVYTPRGYARKREIAA